MIKHEHHCDCTIRGAMTLHMLCSDLLAQLILTRSAAATISCSAQLHLDLTSHGVMSLQVWQLVACSATCTQGCDWDLHLLTQVNLGPHNTSAPYLTSHMAPHPHLFCIAGIPQQVMAAAQWQVLLTTAAFSCLLGKFF